MRNIKFRVFSGILLCLNKGKSMSNVAMPAVAFFMSEIDSDALENRTVSQGGAAESVQKGLYDHISDLGAQIKDAVGEFCGRTVAWYHSDNWCARALRWAVERFSEILKKAFDLLTRKAGAEILTRTTGVIVDRLMPSVRVLDGMFSHTVAYWVCMPLENFLTLVIDGLLAGASRGIIIAPPVLQNAL